MEENQKKILYVDDDFEQVELASIILEDLGYKVLTASNGDDALAMALRNKPDVVIMDTDMPGKKGYEVCADILSKEQLSGTRVIGIGGGNNRDYWMDAGANTYMRKPFDPEELEKKVSEVLD